MTKEISKYPVSIQDARERIERLKQFQCSTSKSLVKISSERIAELQKWIDARSK